MPCADRPDRRTAAQAQTLTPDLFRPTRASLVHVAGFAAAPDRGEANDPLDDAASCADARQGHAGAVADRADPDLRPAGRERRRRSPATTRSTASARSRNSIRGRPKPKPPSVPAVRRRSPSNARLRLSIPPSESAQQDADPAGDGRHRAGPAAAQAAEGRRRSVRRGRRLRRQLSDQVRGRTLAAATTPIPRRTRRRRRARRSTWSRRNCWRSPTGSATRWSPICAARSPAMATPFRRRPTAAVSSAPVDIDRPDFTGHVDGRLDVTPRHQAARPGAAARRDRQSRQPEHPGRPRQISDLHHARRHLRRRPEFQPAAGLRRRHRRPHRLSADSKLTDGTSTTNDDRNFNQYRRRRRASATI